MGDREDGWYWCLEHHKVERRGECRADRRLGPYRSAEEAANWQQRVERRNDAWDAEDERWERR